MIFVSLYLFVYLLIMYHCVSFYQKKKHYTYVQIKFLYTPEYSDIKFSAPPQFCKNTQRLTMTVTIFIRIFY